MPNWSGSGSRAVFALTGQGIFLDCCVVDLPPAVEDIASDSPRGPSLMGVALGPAWLFVSGAAIVVALGAIGLPINLLPPEMWALRPLLLANSVVSLLLGAAVFGRRPDTWTTNRPLGAAVVLIAVGVLAETLSAVAVSIAWLAAFDLLPDAGWMLLAFGHANGALHVAGVALIWLALHRSLRPGDRRGSKPLAAVLWGVALVTGVGRLASTVQTFDSVGMALATVSVALSFVTGIASIVALTALTLTAITGARAGERPTSAWWLAGASGLLIVVGQWVAPILAMVANQPVLFSILLPQALGLASTLLLLLALALGLPSSQGTEPHRAVPRGV